MRVAIIVSRMEQLGPIIVIRNLVNSLRFCNDLSVNVFYIDKEIKDSIQMDATVERLNWRKFSFDDFDIVHTNGIRPDLFAYLNRKKIKCHVSTIHNIVFEELTFNYNRFISLLFGNIWLILWKRADKLVCVSSALKTYYSRWFDIEKLAVVHNGIEEYDNSPIPEQSITSEIEKFHTVGLTVVGFSGMLTRRKGVDMGLRLLTLRKDLALVVIGDGIEKKSLIRFAKKLKISDRCLFCGFQENASRYFRYFDLFIMPSRSEGFGLALIEAVQKRIPVICSDLNVFKEILNDSEAYFFKSDDIDSLLVAVNRAINEKSSTKTDLAYSRYCNNYTANRMAENYYAVYQSVFI
jgi:L-malate glycosyltransferase